MKRQQGAALMVLLMIAGLMGAMFAIQLAGRGAPGRAQVAATTLALSEAREALIGFALANGRLPCPAPAAVASGLPLAGLEPTPVVGAGCLNVAGVLPWATLGINEADAWGNRFTYRVTKEFTRTVPQLAFASCAIAPPVTPAFSAFALCSRGDMTALSTAGGATMASTVPAMLISHGKNGNGAYYTGGNQLAVGTDADELDNQLLPSGVATANTNFISKTPTDTYDDIVIWLPLDTLSGTMSKANKLP
jgi:type II secretory pathway pseudopilin PulG